MSKDLVTREKKTEAIAVSEKNEAETVAREMATAYANAVEYYRTQYKLTPEEADKKASTMAGSPRRLQTAPADKISWLDLANTTELIPNTGSGVWERLKREARNELESGHRAGAALEYYSQPMDRARFLAVRESFMKEWEPRGGIEQSLIDMMAQSYTAHLYWLELLHQRSVTEGKREKEDLEQSEHWKLPYVREHEAVEQAAAMADRFHRLFIRNLRALRDLRRYMPNVTIQNVGQLNIAAEGGQQVNLAKGRKASKTGQGKRRVKARQVISNEK